MIIACIYIDTQETAHTVIDIHTNMNSHTDTHMNEYFLPSDTQAHEVIQFMSSETVLFHLNPTNKGKTQSYSLDLIT